MILTENAASQGFTEESVLRPDQLRSPKKRRCCHGGGDGFTIITVCFFILAAAITVALIIHNYYGSPEVLPHGAVATDNEECSRVGAAILGAGGSAVDVAIAAVVCLMVVHPHNVGPGGSGVMLIHDHKSNSTIILDFLTAIPSSYNLQDPPPGPTEGRSVGVPGLIKGLEHAHHKFGKLPWEDLIKPSVNIARRGFNISTQLGDALKLLNVTSSQADTLFGHFVFPNGRRIVRGDFMKRDNLAHFLEMLAVRGSPVLYEFGFDSADMRAMQAAGAQVTAQDFQAYKVGEWPSLQVTLHNHTIHTTPIAGGPQLVAALHHLHHANITTTTPQPLLYHAFIQAIRTSQTFFPHLESEMDVSAQNLTWMDDLALGSGGGGGGSVMDAASLPTILSQQAGSPVSVMDTFDQYVATVVGLGTPFGSQHMTQHGIIFNNHLSALPATTGLNPHHHHHLARPFTSYTPVVITEANKVCGRRVVLASGEMGAAVQVVGQLVVRRKRLIDAIKQRRVTLNNNDNNNNLIFVDDLRRDDEVPPLSGDVKNFVEEHNPKTAFRVQLPPYTGVNGITKNKDSLTSWSDSRGGGVAHRLEPSVKHRTNATGTQPPLPPPLSTTTTTTEEPVVEDQPIALP